MELLPNQTWDTITNNLRQYDRSDTIMKKEQANAASAGVYCYGYELDKQVTSSRMAPIDIKGELKVLLVAAVVAKVVVKIFLEAAEVKEKAAGDTRTPVEAKVKKEEKEKVLIIILTHVLVISVIRQVILL